MTADLHWRIHQANTQFTQNNSEQTKSDPKKSLSTCPCSERLQIGDSARRGLGGSGVRIAVAVHVAAMRPEVGGGPH